MTAPRLDAISMEGFKCFDALKIDLGQLTLVTGFNGGGKSTSLQPLLLIAQALRFGDPKILPLNGPLVRLGTAGDIAPINSERQTILRAESSRGTIELRPKLNAGDRNLSIADLGHATPDAELKEHLAALSFLSAVRLGAEDAYPIPEHVSFPNVGHDGRFAPYWYNRLVDEEVHQQRLMQGLEATTLRKQLDAWLGALFTGAQANVQHFVALSQMSLQFRLSELGSWRRPVNIGYGLTYVFPILVALLAARDGQLVVIDSPESHLHPSAQSQMGRILAHFANSGVQIIVETHSDHLLNGIRLAVREGDLHPQKLRLHFFRGPSVGNHGVISPSIGTGGEIYEWPDGFFDQGEKDLSRLAGWS